METKGINYDASNKVDEKDKKIMKALFEDGRMSVAQIEKRTGIRRDSVARRLKRLVNDKVITGFVPIINAPSLGYPNVALFMVRIKTNSAKNKEKFIKKLVANKFTVHISQLIGKFDFLSALIYKDTNHLNQIVEEVKNYVPNFVEDFELYQVASEPKFEDMASLL